MLDFWTGVVSSLSLGVFLLFLVMISYGGKDQ